LTVGGILRWRTRQQTGPFRIGQEKNVEVHKFICAGTLEERIDEMIERKKEIAEKVIGAGEAWLTELSTTELKKLFALSKEAVGD